MSTVNKKGEETTSQKGEEGFEQEVCMCDPKSGDLQLTTSGWFQNQVKIH